MASDHRFIRVIGAAELLDGEHVEIVVDEWALNQAMLDYGLRIFQLSLAISIFTGFLVFVAVNAFLVRPMRRVIAGMATFREDPEDASRLYQATGAGGEIGQAEIEHKDVVDISDQELSVIKEALRLSMSDRRPN